MKAHGRAKAPARLKVADEVWIATALLHCEQPEREDFTVIEITQRAARENLHGSLRPGIYQHAFQHAVANRAPDGGRYRMLFATGKLTRRLYRPGDPFHPRREQSKTVPSRDDIPAAYHRLLDWYQETYLRRSRTVDEPGILALCGLGKEIWRGVDPDDYVRQLREGWE